nr:MAG TPA: hypothetical protein [Bacteriophage sp.]
MCQVKHMYSRLRSAVASILMNLCLTGFLCRLHLLDSQVTAWTRMEKNLIVIGKNMMDIIIFLFIHVLTNNISYWISNNIMLAESIFLSQLKMPSVGQRRDIHFIVDQ